MENEPTHKVRPQRYRSRQNRQCCTCRLSNYSLLIVGLVEAFIIVYYVATIIVVSYIYGKYYEPTYDRHRQYWTSLLAVRYFVLFALFGFPVSLMTRKCRPILIYGIKNVTVAAYALTSSISSVVILTTPMDTWTSDESTTRPSSETDNDPILRMMRVYGVADAVINAACALAEVWFIFLAFNLDRDQASWAPEVETNNQIDQPQQRSEASSGDLLDCVADTINSPVSPPQQTPPRRNAMTTDIVSILLGKV